MLPQVNMVATAYIIGTITVRWDHQQLMQNLL
jgi:hypothetical protein